MVQFGAVTLLSAFLLFLVQPLVARQILPWFGGAQSVWATCLVFYQVLLVCGYLYGHLGRGLGIRRQAILHSVLLVASLALLPIAASERWKPTGAESPTWPLVALLATTVGGPYLLLASTAPLLHDWFGRRHPDRSPYPLYAVSNAGSLGALLAYPLVVEPLFGVSRQALVWSAAYGAFALACIGLALGVARVQSDRATARAEPDRPAGPGPSPDQIALWVALSACGSGLLLALTNHMTMDVAAVPFLWVLPLALYLITFILAFAGRYRRTFWGALLVLALAAMAILWNWGFALPLALQIVLSCGVLFAGCMVCHGEIARSAPAPTHLTTFYLTMAAGGALGGILVGLVAPAVLTDFWELPAVLLLACGLLLLILVRDPGSGAAPGLRTATAVALVAVIVLTTVGFVLPTVGRHRGTVATARNFYGVVRVQDVPEGMLVGQRAMRVGRIFHGGQFLDPRRAGEPTAYYGAGSGVDVAIRRHPHRLAGRPLHIGVIGLGVGTLAALAQSGDSVRFYEINPTVVSFAERYFTFLGDSPADISVVLGDGRLALERELAGGSAGRFDVLVIDAFSGDAIPVHLLTRESMELYERALADDGVLVFQVTNRHLDLVPVVRGLAQDRDMVPVPIGFIPPEGSGGAPSIWMLVSRSPRLLEQVRPRAMPFPSERTVLWTDDYSNVLGILR